jgi:hypothetical protein
MTGSLSSIIPFDSSGFSYVIREIEGAQLERTDLDELNRTAEDRQFLQDYETIFLAASLGDLATCKAVVKRGFKDLHALSISRFGSDPGVYLEHVSPFLIAALTGQDKVLAYFNKVLQKNACTGKQMPETSCSTKFGKKELEELKKIGWCASETAQGASRLNSCPYIHPERIAAFEIWIKNKKSQAGSSDESVSLFSSDVKLSEPSHPNLTRTALDLGVFGPPW